MYQKIIGKIASDVDLLLKSNHNPIDILYGLHEELTDTLDELAKKYYTKVSFVSPLGYDSVKVLKTLGIAFTTWKGIQGHRGDTTAYLPITLGITKPEQFIETINALQKLYNINEEDLIDMDTITIN
jgi:hypothetical protein